MSAKDPFDTLLDTVVGGGGHHAAWGQHQRRIGVGFNERRFRKALRNYWGVQADPMRISLAVQDAPFVAGVLQTVSEQLRLDAGDRRKISAATVRRRLLGEPDATLDAVDAAWNAWWPPPPGDDGRMRFAEFLGAWRAWLEHSGA